MVDPALELSEVSISFGGIRAVDGVTLSVTKGEIVGLIGPNGAGKTTLMNLISGHYLADTGRIHITGRDVTSWPVHLRARHGLARSYQKTNIFPGLTVWENVWIAAAAARVGHFRLRVPTPQEQEVADACLGALEVTGLSLDRDTVASSLSHGGSRALEVAMLLASNGEVLLLDEPAAGMPMHEVTRTMSTLRSIHERTNATMVIVEHKLPVVFGLCDRIAVLDQGRLLAVAPPEAIRTDARVREAYLGDSLE